MFGNYFCPNALSSMFDKVLNILLCWIGYLTQTEKLHQGISGTLIEILLAIESNNTQRRSFVILVNLKSFKSLTYIPWQISYTCTEVYPKLWQIPRMKGFVTITNSFQPLTIVAKFSNVKVCGCPGYAPGCSWFCSFQKFDYGKYPFQRMYNF